MNTIYDNIGIILVLAVIAGYWLFKLYHWIMYKNKYPILSSEPPSGIIEIGDTVYFGNIKKEFRGVSRTDGIWFVFMPDDSVSPEYMDRSDAIKRMDAIYGRYGIKWKKVN